MATPPLGENLSNAPVIEVKNGLSNLKRRMETDASDADIITTVGEMNSLKTKIAEAKTAAATADKKTLEELSLQIDATDSPLNKFIDDAYIDATEGGIDDAITDGLAAQEFKNEVTKLKTVVKEKIAEPRTMTDKLVALGERAADGIGNVMGKIGKWASELSVSAMNGLKSFFAMIGFPAGVTFLEGFLKPAEVHETIKDVLGEKTQVVKDKSDASALRNLEAAHKKELETRKDLTFEAFCRERAEKLKTGFDEKRNYKIADLLITTDPALPPPDTKKAPDPTNQPLDPINPNDQAPESEVRKAGHLCALAYALEKAGLTLEEISRKKNGGWDRKPLVNVLQTLTPSSIRSKDGAARANNLKDAIFGVFSDYTKTHQMLGVELDHGVLQLDDGHNWGYDPRLIANFNPSTNPVGAIKQLLDLKIENGKLPDGTELNGTAKIALPELQARLIEAKTWYKID